MENREYKHQNRRPAGPMPAAAAGFTLIELVVVITVMGVLAAAIISNWASFMRHQELRGDAINLHKEILALKARAIEYGYGDTLIYVVDANKYALKWLVPNSTDTLSSLVTREVKLNSMVKIWQTPGENTNKWQDNLNHTDVRITVMPDNVDAYDDGWIMLMSRDPTKIKARYRIIKKADYTGIRPELEYRPKEPKAGDTSWTKM
jgi:prepilin-type N-terminal cleavage/methylation domain-containing protein